MSPLLKRILSDIETCSDMAAGLPAHGVPQEELPSISGVPIAHVTDLFLRKLWLQHTKWAHEAIVTTRGRGTHRALAEMCGQMFWAEVIAMYRIPGASWEKGVILSSDWKVYQANDTPPGQQPVFFGRKVQA